NFLEAYLTQGESEDPTKCAILGKYVFSDISYVGGTERAVIEVRYEYDQNGVVTVSATERSTGRTLPMTIEQVPEDMSWLSLPPVEQKATSRLTCYLAFDLSGSMSGEPLKESKRAGLEFVEKMDLTSSSVGLIAFADRNETKVHACQDVKKINRGIRDLKVGSVGGGNETDPFEHALALLREEEDPRYLIVLADGVWNSQYAAERAARECHRNGIEIISIGFGDADRAFLERISTTSMGSIYTSLSGLSEAFSAVAQALTEGSVTSSGLRRMT
ncbi:MAG: VWA domain-containing protein, partial [Verrucomicrobia bacterium]|nr:VWA domain-containing protein [Verrucomicrobiota bacterium]